MAATDMIPQFDSPLLQPLNPEQQRIWSAMRLSPDAPVYNESEAVRLTGELNVDALQRAMNAIIGRHEALRSMVRMIDEVPHSVIHKSWTLRFNTIDLSARSLPEQRSELDSLLLSEPRTQHHLEASPGIRATLLRLNLHEHVFILTVHRIVCDWASLGIIWQELSALYRAFVTGVAVTLSASPIARRNDPVLRQQKPSGKRLSVERQLSSNCPPIGPDLPRSLTEADGSVEGSAAA
jgi:hypothetical protein